MHPRPFSPVLVPSSAKGPAEAFDPSCFDFTAYLGSRLGVEAAVAREREAAEKAKAERAAARAERRERNAQAPILNPANRRPAPQEKE